MTARRITKTVVEEFMQTVGRLAHGRPEMRFYLAGGATAILFGFRNGTVDIDLAGELDPLFQEIPKITDDLDINIEAATPTDFVPSLAGEADRHVYIATYGRASFFHFDPYAQAFSKIVRAHGTDIEDAANLARSGRVQARRLLRLVKDIPEAGFARYVRLHRDGVIRSVEEFAKATASKAWRG